MTHFSSRRPVTATPCELQRAPSLLTRPRKWTQNAKPMPISCLFFFSLSFTSLTLNAPHPVRTQSGRIGVWSPSGDGAAPEGRAEGRAAAQRSARGHRGSHKRREEQPAERTVWGFWHRDARTGERVTSYHLWDITRQELFIFSAVNNIKVIQSVDLWAKIFYIQKYVLMYIFLFIHIYIYTWT